MYVCLLLLLLLLLTSSCKLQATANRESKSSRACVWVRACRFDNKQQVQVREAVQSKRAQHERVAVQLLCVCVSCFNSHSFRANSWAVRRDSVVVCSAVQLDLFRSLTLSRLPAAAHALLSRAGGKRNIFRQCCVCHCVISQCHSEWREPQKGGELFATNFIDARLCQTARRKGSSNNNNELLKCRYIYLCVCVCSCMFVGTYQLLNYSKNVFRTMIAWLSECVCVYLLRHPIK